MSWTEKVSYDEARAFTSDFGIELMEVSAKTSENISEAFELLVMDMIEKRRLLKSDEKDQANKSGRISIVSLPPRRKETNNCCK